MRGPFRPFLPCAIRPLHRRAKPPGDVEPDPRNVGVVRDRSFDEVMRNGVKETFDVHIDDPVGGPASLPGRSHCIERGFAGTVAIRVGMEMRLHQRLEDHLRHGLGHAIGYSRNA